MIKNIVYLKKKDNVKKLRKGFIWNNSNNTDFKEKKLKLVKEISDLKRKNWKNKNNLLNIIQTKIKKFIKIDTVIKNNDTYLNL